jgi:hypothetical protein
MRYFYRISLLILAIIGLNCATSFNLSKWQEVKPKRIAVIGFVNATRSGLIYNRMLYDHFIKLFPEYDTVPFNEGVLNYIGLVSDQFYEISKKRFQLLRKNGEKKRSLREITIELQKIEKEWKDLLQLLSSWLKTDAILIGYLETNPTPLYGLKAEATGHLYLYSSNGNELWKTSYNSSTVIRGRISGQHIIEISNVDYLIAMGSNLINLCSEIIYNTLNKFPRKDGIQTYKEEVNPYPTRIPYICIENNICKILYESYWECTCDIFDSYMNIYKSIKIDREPFIKIFEWNLDLPPDKDQITIEYPWWTGHGKSIILKNNNPKYFYQLKVGRNNKIEKEYPVFTFDLNFLVDNSYAVRPEYNIWGYEVSF